MTNIEYNVKWMRKLAGKIFPHKSVQAQSR